MPELFLTATQSAYFNSTAFAPSIQGLGVPYLEALPFALSFDLHVSRIGVEVDPTVSLWAEEQGAICRYELGGDTPGLTQDFAVAGFSFLRWGNMRSEMEKVLLRMIPYSPGETFHAAITPHGIILLAAASQDVREDHGPEAVAGALVPTGLNAHQRLTSGEALGACIARMIRYEAQGNPLVAEPDTVTVVIE